MALKSFGQLQNNNFLLFDIVQGLEKAVSSLLPNAEHRNCARHIYSNWKKKGHSTATLRTMFWKAVKCTTRPEFQRIMGQMKALKAQAAYDFAAVGVHKFCKAYISTWPKSEATDNNISESFNSYILRWRSIPIIDMLENIRNAVMRRIVRKRKVFLGRSDELCPEVRKLVNVNISRSRQCFPLDAGDNKYEVTNLGNKFVVDLRAKTCGCGYWDMMGIPCSHVITCIHLIQLNPADFVHDYFKRDKYNMAYSSHIPPMNGRIVWRETDGNYLSPLLVRRQLGRPKRKRRIDNSEMDPNRPSSSRMGVRMTCSFCHHIGHNRKTCPLRSIQDLNMA